MATNLPENVGPTRNLERITLAPGADLMQLDAQQLDDVASQVQQAIVSVANSVEGALLIILDAKNHAVGKFFSDTRDQARCPSLQT